MRLARRVRPPDAAAPLVRNCDRFQRHNSWAWRALSGYGKEALPGVREALAAGGLNEHAQAAAAIMMAHLGDRSQWALLEQVVTAGSGRAMNGAAGRIADTKNAVFLPLVEKALQRDDAEQTVTYAAAYCGGRDALPMLRRALEHPNGGVRSGAKMWIEKLSGEESGDR